MIYLLLLFQKELNIVFMKALKELMKHIIIQLIIMIIQKDIKNMLIIRQDKMHLNKNFIKDPIQKIVKNKKNLKQDSNFKKFFSLFLK